jgi:hypothetical protein
MSSLLIGFYITGCFFALFAIVPDLIYYYKHPDTRRNIFIVCLEVLRWTIFSWISVIVYEVDKVLEDIIENKNER